jgi:hypothetical protein
VYGGTLTGDGMSDGTDMQCSLNTSFSARTGG